MAQRDVHQNRAPAGTYEKIPARPAESSYPVQELKVPQDARRVRPEHQTRADLAQFIRPLINRRFNPGTLERYRCCHTTDTTTDDADAKFMVSH